MTIEENLSSANHRILPAGFRFAGVACGIKPSGKPDLSLIVADRTVVAAGVYTQNQVVAAPVEICRSRTPSEHIRAVVTNSGNANACTGDQGRTDALQMCQSVAAQIGCDAEQVLVMSTGVIGHPLPMDKVCRGIETASTKLAASGDAFSRAADAILTTDKDRKSAIETVRCGDQTYRIAAMAKGAGMIAPDMATMLAVMLTDAPLADVDAQRLLLETAEQSFNRVSVDGHTSTNDTVLLLSSGGGEPLSGEALDEFQQQLGEISKRLAKLLVADGEGASHIMAISVAGADDDDDALEIARRIAESPLVKTAITGGDPNWGRIVSAAGNAKARIDVTKTTLSMLGTTIYRDGAPVDFGESILSERMQRTAEIAIDLVVGDGRGTANFWASDLTTEYVQFNSEYTT